MLHVHGLVLNRAVSWRDESDNKNRNGYNICCRIAKRLWAACIDPVFSNTSPTAAAVKCANYGTVSEVVYCSSNYFSFLKLLI